MAYWTPSTHGWTWATEAEVPAFAVGGVYINLTGTNPATELGYGTWAAFGAGRLLVGLDAADPDFDTVRETGGAKTHTHGDQLGHDAHAVTQPGNHLVTQPGGHGDHSGVPSHVHPQQAQSSASGGTGKYALDTNASGSQLAVINTAANTGAANQAHTNNHSGAAVDAHSGTAVGAHAAHGSHGATDHKPPYIVVYMWERTA